MTWRGAARTVLATGWLALLLPLQTGATCGGVSYETGGEGGGCQSAALIAAAVVGGLAVAVTAGVLAYRYFAAIKTITDLSVGLSTHLPTPGGAGGRQAADGRVEITAHDDSYSISHAASGSGVIATLDGDGELMLMMARNEGSPISGRQMFDRVMEHFGGRVEVIRGYWVYGDNLAAFSAAMRDGGTLREAARGTWTGRQAARHGFTRVKVPIADEGVNGYTKVSALFRRERG
ncbi:hypothetical protein [Dactylosporangium sp. CS-033363]|uniref:hypothetical protein n=1 Tax=Dactylosporangium sp. CS-033363 TaxID=3239935 RepID=UPI003D8D3C5E